MVGHLVEDEEEAASKGHNRTGGIAVELLQVDYSPAGILEEEKTGIAEAIKDVYAESKGVGFDVATVRKIIALRKKDPAEREEEDYLLHTYLRAIGMEPEEV